jgi:hypothetical protein
MLFVVRASDGDWFLSKVHVHVFVRDLELLEKLHEGVRVLHQTPDVGGRVQHLDDLHHHPLLGAIRARVLHVHHDGLRECAREAVSKLLSPP